MVRGLGLLESVEDIENLLITTKGSSPIRVKEVATVSVSAKPRQGQVGLNYDDDVVQGIVIMLRGENPSEVIARLKDKITELNDRILPEDIKIVPFMDRTRLVDATVHTVIGNMLEGFCLCHLSCSCFCSTGVPRLLWLQSSLCRFFLQLRCFGYKGCPPI